MMIETLCDVNAQGSFNDISSFQGKRRPSNSKL